MSKEVEALQIERAGYVQRGLKDRVKAVDDVLRALGVDQRQAEQPMIESATIEPSAERAVRKAAPKRRA